MLASLYEANPSTIVEFNVAVDGWHISEDENGVHWLYNGFAESFKLPALEESDLVNVARMMLVAFIHGYAVGRDSLNSH